MADLALNLSETLDQKILGFKSDPEKMKEIHEFLNELFEKACIEAEHRQGAGSAIERKTKFDTIGLQNGTKRIGAWSNRARGLMSRVITAICNCTNSVRNATTNRT